MGTPNFILACKLKALNYVLKKYWNVKVFGNVESLKNSLVEELQDLEGREVNGVLYEKALLRKCSLVPELERVLLMEEIF